MSNNRICLVSHVKFARDGGAIDIGYDVYANRELAEEHVKNAVAIKQDKDEIIKHKDGTLDQIRINDDSYPWTPREIWYFYDKDIKNY